jgi:hypothetical protein
MWNLVSDTAGRKQAEVSNLQGSDYGIWHSDVIFFLQPLAVFVFITENSST